MRFGVSARIAFAAVVFSVIPCTVVSARAASAQAAVAKTDIADTWQGTLQVGRDLRTVVKISKTADGKLKAQFYSIDQNPRPIDVTDTIFHDGELTLKVDLIGGVYTGKMAPDGNTITGEWKQGDKPLPLILARATKETAWAIPEPPKPVPPMAADGDPNWDVATVKPAPPDERGKGFGGPPRHFRTGNTTLNDLVMFAYQVNTKQIINGPAWMESDKFDITTGEPDLPGAPSDDQVRSMMRKLLADRFGLKFHKGQQQMSAYVISVAKGGPKLTASKSDPHDPTAFFFPKLGSLVFRNISMDGFASWMQNGVFDRPVVNRTEIPGRFDGTLKWTPDETQFQIFGVKIVPDESADAPPPITPAMDQQLGLKLSAEKTAVDVMILDHVEKPSDN
ncbi:TIGR03435 family protein [Terriglobus sp. ADX1]|uniref:TIGR03435 family protein n=1 Tax=Terriglobus sp. ADX1 TaxID=2794063 RepID=UPI002FE5A45A